MKSHVSKSKRVALLGRGLKCDAVDASWFVAWLVEAAFAIKGDETEISPTTHDKINGRMIDKRKMSLL